MAPMDDFSMRTATLSDIDELFDLWINMQCHMEESNRWIWRITEEGKVLVREKVRQVLVDKNSLVFVADRNGEAVGFIYGQVVRRTDYLPRNVGIISNIYVAKGFRRSGLGRRLVEKLCHLFSKDGVEQVTLRYVIGNVEGEEFWRRLGFEPIITTASTRLDQLRKRLRD
ncbi:MAG: GNAT family N-acetyltransferase [Candidatus Bathyarchaeia archaeon]